MNVMIVSVLKTAYPGQYCSTADSRSFLNAEYLGHKHKNKDHPL